MLRRLLAQFGQLHGPGPLLAGIDLEKSGTVIAAWETITDAADRELLVAGAHKGLPHPLAAVIVVDCVDIIITRDEITLEHGLAGAGGQIPPAFRGPAVGILITDGHAHPACGVVAQPEIGRRRPGRCGQNQHCQRKRAGSANSFDGGNPLRGPRSRGDERQSEPIGISRFAHFRFRIRSMLSGCQR